ncbi:MAG: Imm26 family immunity protein [Bryobacteraceae bacterium]
MGWFESSKYPGVMLGDEPFDIADQFLTELQQAYMEAFKRAPTLAEVRNLLEITLRVTGRQMIQDLEELEVTSLSIKTAKKKKDQPFAPGDVFNVPLENSGFAFGRILTVDKALGCLVEIFKHMSDKPIFIPGPSEKRLFQPVLVGSEGFRSWRWTIISKDDSYQPPADISTLEYVGGSPSIGYSVVTVRNKIVRRATEQDRKTLPASMIYQSKQLEDKIKVELQKQSAVNN